MLTSTPRRDFRQRRPRRELAGARGRDQFRCATAGGLAQKADDPETLFVATGDGAAGSTGAIQRSRDGGRSWEKLTLPVEPNSPIWAFATHPADPGADRRVQPLRRTVRERERRRTWAKLRREFTEIRALCWVPN